MRDYVCFVRSQRHDETVQRALWWGCLRWHASELQAYAHAHWDGLHHTYNAIKCVAGAGNGTGCCHRACRAVAPL